LNFAVVWVAGIVSLSILVFMPQLLSTSFLAEVAAACLVVRFGRQLRISTPRAESGGARDQNFGKQHTLTACFPPEAELWTGAWPHLARMSRACENRPHG
jgi:hypothetical protein